MNSTTRLILLIDWSQHQRIIQGTMIPIGYDDTHSLDQATFIKQL